MTLLALSGGDTALIVIASFWGLLVLALCVVLLNTFRVLESTKITIDTMREEIVPILREVTTTVNKTNSQIDHIDTVLTSAESIVGRVEKLSGLVEQAASSPLVKVISVGTGIRAAVSKVGGKRSSRAAKT